MIRFIKLILTAFYVKMFTHKRYSKYFTTTKNYIYSYCIYLLVLLPGCCATGAGGPSSSSAMSGLDLLPPAGHLLLGQEDLAVEEHNQEQRDEERACK